MSTSVISDQRTPLSPRMKSPVEVVPEALAALLVLNKVSSQSGLSHTLFELVHLRASQINGCSVCVLMHAADLKRQGESDERIFAVSAWREAALFTDAERAALALTEAGTRLSDQGVPVSEEVFAEAARHFSERQLADLILHIAQINFWNRLNVIVARPALPVPRPSPRRAVPRVP